MKSGSVILTLSLLAVIGCNVHTPVSHPFEKGYQDFDRVQVQFYTPEGAQVTIGKVGLFETIEPQITHQIGSYGEGKHKLEVEPEQTATFNLHPGRYELKYNAAKGWPGVSIYGELDIYKLSPKASAGAKDMLRRCFIPVALPAPGLLEQSGAEDTIFPYQSPITKLRITQQDVERLAAGDLIVKVVFIADLEEAEKNLDNLEVELTGLKAERQRLQALLNEAQLDWLENPHEKEFIKLQKELKKLDITIKKLEGKMERLRALIKADNVLIRKEMLVLATDEILPPHTDPIKAASELGHIVLVMKLGGRHMHWGNPPQELSQFNK